MNFLLFDNQDNFALLDTPEGAIYNNGLYEQLAYVFDNLPTGWNQFPDLRRKPSMTTGCR